MLKILLAIVISAAVIGFVWNRSMPDNQINFFPGSESSGTTVIDTMPNEHLETPVETAVDTFSMTVPMKIKDVSVMASIADTEAERQQGLSGTSALPDGVVKLFVFENETPHGFWMKDMNYPIDIVWVDRTGTIVHIAPSVPEDSYPTVYRPDIPVRYVIETVAGFMAEQGIVVGDTVTLPEGIE